MAGMEKENRVGLMKNARIHLWGLCKGLRSEQLIKFINRGPLQTVVQIGVTQMLLFHVLFDCHTGYVKKHIFIVMLLLLFSIIFWGGKVISMRYSGMTAF